MPLHLPPSVKNWTSLAGVVIALISLFMIVFLFAVTVFFDAHAAYLGLVVYILLPSVMIAGLILIPVGMLLKIRREHREGLSPEPGWPKVDLNNPGHRNAALIFFVGTSLLLFASAIGSYEAFHYTESTAFCGTLCHSVMEPEHVAHKTSAHARVACVACHVGPGADWYVRSKLSGMYQVYAVLTDVYPRPIPTPIENLRPARTVCEQCHWPQKFYAYTYRAETHYLPDEKNTRWDIGLTLRVGAPHSAVGFEEGIHWHINPQVKIEYLPLDEKREQIARVRYTNLESGEVKIYRNPALAQEGGEAGEMRTMDCIDCHNRPSHRYLPPNRFVDNAMANGSIPADLPWIKAATVPLCEQEFASREEAEEILRAGVLNFYRQEHPEILEQRMADVEKAIAGFLAAFNENIFPYMKARWSAYPEHIGHLVFNGCFRCHAEGFATEEGEPIRSGCNDCHLISSQGTPGSMEYAPMGESLDFRHPEDIGEAWKEMLCSDCHKGLLP
ncbi:NapC/NirT family cytochrome c [Desulfuromonas sp. TF]|uniref:NapC/NirT family cytochrome c n=1 Tax=Desulfuromonas sp. TF TaxID=1232410 RepID=UPI00041BC9B0|nr:NapC/NirT family cytochrome c [Desulfuromonas sp. TF]